MIFGIFVTLAEFERDLIRALTKAKVRLARLPWSSAIPVAALCNELEIQRVTLYRYVGPTACSGATAKKVLGFNVGFRLLAQTTPNCADLEYGPVLRRV
jgi:hypothetical protein